MTSVGNIGLFYTIVASLAAVGGSADSGPTPSAAAAASPSPEAVLRADGGQLPSDVNYECDGGSLDTYGQLPLLNGGGNGGGGLQYNSSGIWHHQASHKRCISLGSVFVSRRETP